MAKQVYECNWVPSRVTETQLENLVKIGTLGEKDVIHWRVPGPESVPEPKDGEVVVFADHLARGFSPPGSKFFKAKSQDAPLLYFPVHNQVYVSPIAPCALES